MLCSALRDEMMNKDNQCALILVFFEEKKETGDLAEMSELQAETCLRLKCVAHKNLSLSVQTTAPPRPPRIRLKPLLVGAFFTFHLLCIVAPELLIKFPAANSTLGCDICITMASSLSRLSLETWTVPLMSLLFTVAYYTTGVFLSIFQFSYC